MAKANDKLVPKKSKPAKSDVETIIEGAEGWHLAFRRMMADAGLSQAGLAELLGVDASAVAHWCSSRYRPQPETLKQALLKMGADPRVVFRHMDISPELKAILDKQLSQEDAALEVSRILLEGASNEQTISAIFDHMSPLIIASLSVRALKSDKAAEIYFA
jgi:transcriptional regulator with XRE-family HTH domain